MITLVVDGVFFQFANTGIARVWRSLLALLAADRRFRVCFLDRGNAPAIDGIEYIPFPAYRWCECPADSQLIQDVCDMLGADAFTSTYYTTPVTTPMLLVVYDMIPELFDFNMSERGWMEKTNAISFAQRYLCISDNTRQDLLALYPEIPDDVAAMAHCGVDADVFHQHAPAAIAGFRQQYALDRPYFLFVGSRVQHNGYKNSQLFFEALPRMVDAQFDVFCVGGEPEIEPAILDSLPTGVRCRRAELSDEELAQAYGGALALVYPSLYEGFGMPVIEAMASGCPVITTGHGSLGEAAGDAAMRIGGESAEEMRAALAAMFDPQTRERLRERGLAQAANFRWEDMARQFKASLESLVADARAGHFDAFAAEWQRLRGIQAHVE